MLSRGNVLSQKCEIGLYVCCTSCSVTSLNEACLRFTVNEITIYNFKLFENVKSSRHVIELFR